MKEIWKEIKNYQGYEVSNLGSVKSYKKCKSGKILAKPLDVDGYVRISIYAKNMPKMQKVHRLVAMAFIPNPENKPCINHINGVKTDNRMANLEWCTVAENNQHAFKNGLNSNVGEDHHNSSLTKQDVLIIRKLYSKETKTVLELSEMFNVADSTIRVIIKNIAWVDNSYVDFREGIKLGVGENHHMAKLNENDIINIRDKYSTGSTSYRKLGNEYGVDKALIGRIVKRKLWKHVK